MDTKTLMTVEEYLRSPFDGPDRDYVDGEVIERNMGELPHARLQAELFLRLSQAATIGGFQVLPEIRVQVSPTRFRLADIAAWRSGPIGQRIPTVPPFVIVEILSPEDRIVRLSPKIQEYLAYGVERVWVVDPEERPALSFSAAQPGGVLVDVLRTDNPEIALPLADVLSVLDR